MLCSSCSVKQPVAILRGCCLCNPCNDFNPLTLFVCQSDVWMDSPWIWWTDGSLPKEQFIKEGRWSWSGISSTRWSCVFYETNRGLIQNRYYGERKSLNARGMLLNWQFGKCFWECPEIFFKKSSNFVL